MRLWGSYGLPLHLNYANMWWRRIIYGSVTIVAYVFYLYYGQWMAWILLLGMLLLPWISLLLSLPAILLTKIDLVCPETIPMNSRVFVTLYDRCSLPTPPIKWKFQAYESFSKKKLTFHANAPFLADHCGSIYISLKRSYIYDYLGLVSIPIGRKIQKTILVLPETVPVKNIPSLKKYLAANWKPKPGGGFSENYDLREYHPGDDLRQVHWKLAAKTGKIIVREPIIPIRGNLVLSMTLKGSESELDRKFGRLSFLSEYFIEKELPFEIQCATGDGLHRFKIRSKGDFTQALHTLLQLPLATEDMTAVANASWHYRIGGGEYEE